jgi:hypothetical protein
MDETEELVNLLTQHGWRQDESGEYVRGRYYVALMPRGVIHVGQRPSAPARPDTNRWGQSRTLVEAIAWVREKSREES